MCKKVEIQELWLGQFYGQGKVKNKKNKIVLKEKNPGLTTQSQDLFCDEVNTTKSTTPEIAMPTDFPEGR